jgi:hypothetical protein
MKAFLILLAAIALSQSALAQSADALGDREARRLIDAFRATSDGVIMPSGIRYTSYFGYARVASSNFPACRMQVLSTYDNTYAGQENAPTLELSTRFRFVVPNDETSLSLSADEIERHCQSENVNSAWFVSEGAPTQDALFAAWAAKGAIAAVGMGRLTYGGVEVHRAADAPISPTITEFARHSPDSLALVEVTYRRAEGAVAADASFDAGHCGLKVHVAFTQTVGANAIENQLSALSVDAVHCYVN